MDAEDRLKFAESLIAIGELYDRAVSASLAEMYFGDLAEYPLAAVLQAFQAHRKDPDRGRFFPKIADLISKLGASSGQSAMVAWAEVLPLMRDSRNARSPDPITERVVQDLGGWLRLGQQSAEQLVWTAKEFAQRYEMYAQHGADMPRIAGPRTGLRLVGRDE